MEEVRFEIKRPDGGAVAGSSQLQICEKMVEGQWKSNYDTNDVRRFR